MAASVQSGQAGEAIAQALAKDRPTIDAAIKSFMSWVAARSLTTTEPIPNVCHASSPEALAYARALLQAINSYTFAVTGKESEESAVVAQIWNGLVSSDQKPSRFLGRQALLHAWKQGLRDNVVLPAEKYEQGSLFLQEFGELMNKYDPTVTPLQDSDANLVWEESGAELERRRKRRAEKTKTESNDEGQAPTTKTAES